MGFDHSYYVLPISKLADFRQACIRCYGQKSFQTQLIQLKSNKASKQQAKRVFDSLFSKEEQDGYTEDEIYLYLEKHKIFYWLAPRPWKENMPFSENYGGLGGSYYITRKENVIAKIKKSEPDWAEQSMELEFNENQLAYGNNLYKQIVQIINACPEDCFVIMGTSY